MGKLIGLYIGDITKIPLFSSVVATGVYIESEELVLIYCRDYSTEVTGEVSDIVAEVL